MDDDRDGSPELTVGRTWEIEVLVPAARKAWKRRPRRRARKKPPGPRGPERWREWRREWRRMLDEGVYSTKAALASGEGVSRAAVTLGLRQLLGKTGP